MRVYAYRISDNVPVIGSATWNSYTTTSPAVVQTAESYADVSTTPGWSSWDITTMTTWAKANSSPLYIALDGGGDGVADTNRIFVSMQGATGFTPYVAVTYMQLVGPPPSPSISAPGKLRVSKMRLR
jgi:hypothetical protein